MRGEQRPVTPTKKSQHTLYRTTSSHLFVHILLGVGVALLIAGIEIGVLWLLKLPPLSDRDLTLLLSSLPTLPVTAPWLLLPPVVGAIGAFVTARMMRRPLALRSYLRTSSEALAAYRLSATRLPDLSAAYETTVVYYQNITEPNSTPQLSELTLPALAHKLTDPHLFILGAPGSGKTLALYLQMEAALQRYRTSKRQSRYLPIYVSLERYSLYLYRRSSIEIVSSAGTQVAESGPLTSAEISPDVTLLDFLSEQNLPGLHSLRPYLRQLWERGELLLLCDDFHLVDIALRSAVTTELLALMSLTKNRVLLTASKQQAGSFPQLERLLDEGEPTCALLQPLSQLQKRGFVERALSETPGTTSQQYTAGQIMQMIQRSRLRYLCSNPFTLLTLLEVVDSVDGDQMRYFDTRAHLFQTYVNQQIVQTLEQRRWRKEPLDETMVLRFLGRLACGMYWSGARNTLQLLPGRGKRGKESSLSGQQLAGALRTWLTENSAFSPLALPPEQEPATLPPELDDEALLARLLDFAHEAKLLLSDLDGALSFQHAWLAEYFVADYFLNLEPNEQDDIPLRSELFEQSALWSGPLAMWAGLLDDPAELAEHLLAGGRQTAAGEVPGLALALLCLGVGWSPPSTGMVYSAVLPVNIAQGLTQIIHEPANLALLASLMRRYAEEGSPEIYLACLPILLIPGVEALFLQLSDGPVLDLLFDHLREAINNPAYDSHVKRLIPVLGRFGEEALPGAAELAAPGADSSMRLRAAALRILARTAEPGAVAPLLTCLADDEQSLVEGAMRALIRLGPALVLDTLLRELEQYVPDAATRQVQRASLAILDYFLSESDLARQLDQSQRQRVLEAITPLMSEKHPPEIQRLVRDVLVRQVSQTEGGLAHSAEDLVEILVRALSTGDETMVRNVIRVLQQAGSTATPLLLSQLDRQPSDVLRMHIVEVLGGTRDLAALPYLLDLLSDSAPMVQQQVAVTLRHAYVPESIAGLIELVLNHEDEQVAMRAARILSDMGEVVLEPVLQALPHLVSGRTPMLVQALGTLHDPRIIPGLIELLRTPHIEPLLSIALIRTLGQFTDLQVIPPIIDVLASLDTLIYEEAVTVLSQFGAPGLPAMLSALDVPPQRETVVAQRVRRAILGMVPFPGELLIDALPQSSEPQLEQVMLIFRDHGSDAALLLANHLFHPHTRVREAIRRALSSMEGHVVVPALLEVLNRSIWQATIAEYLLRFPNEAIPPLIHLLSDPERGDGAVAILLQFGPSILPALIQGLDQTDEQGRRRARQLVASLVRAHPDLLTQVMHLFGPSLPPRAYESLIEVLTGPLADLSVPVLLTGLGDAYLLGGVSDALARLVRRGDAPHSQRALTGLLEALRSDERRHGAEITLTEIGAPVVVRLGELITDADPIVANAAQHILRDIGVPALPFIWGACCDVSNRPRREAALDIFRSMPTMIIKNELVVHLASTDIQESSMAATLLRERIHDEEALNEHAHQEMVPVLVEHLQTPGSDERTNRRIISLLLLIGGEDVVAHLAQALYEHLENQEALVRAFLFLGKEGEQALWAMYHDPETPPELAVRVVSTLGQLSAYPELSQLAKGLSRYGLSLNRDRIDNLDQLEVSLRALGGLLAGGHWNVRTLQEMRRSSIEDSPERDLYDVLLGWRYGAYLIRLENDLETESKKHQEDISDLAKQLLDARTQGMDSEHERERAETTLEQMQDELGQLRQELISARREIAQLRHEHGASDEELERAEQRAQRYQVLLKQESQEKRMLQEQISQLHAYNAQLVDQLNLLQGAENP